MVFGVCSDLHPSDPKPKGKGKGRCIVAKLLQAMILIFELYSAVDIDEGPTYSVAYMFSIDGLF